MIIISTKLCTFHLHPQLSTYPKAPPPRSLLDELRPNFSSACGSLMMEPGCIHPQSQLVWAKTMEHITAFLRKPPKDSDNFKVGSSYVITPYHIFIVPPGWNSQSHLKPRFRPIAGRSKTRRAWHAKETPAAWGLRGDASESLDPSSAKGAFKDVDLHGWQFLYTNMCPKNIFKGIQVSNKDKWIATLHIGASGPNRNGKGVLFCFFNAWKPPRNIIKQLHPAEKNIKNRDLSVTLW